MSETPLKPSPSTTRVPSRILIFVLFLLMLGMATALYQAISSERQSRAQVQLTTRILVSLRQSMRFALNAETGQRGFLLTGDRLYLEPYEDAKLRWLVGLDELESLLSAVATDAQKAHIVRLQELATAKLKELDRTIELAEQDRRQEALAIVSRDIGQQIMDEYRLVVATLEDEEQAILNRALGQADAVEGRILPILVVLMLAIIALMVLGLWLERRTALAEAAARDYNAVLEARERSDLLARELNHRVKNLFAVILSILSLSSRSETDVKVFARKVRDRIHALSLAHAVSQGQLDAKFVELNDVIKATVDPYNEDGTQVSLEGPKVELPVKAVTPIGMMLHELATNAAKYGALSVKEGKVSVSWSRDSRENVRIEWRESRGPPVDEEGSPGFGSLMMKQAALQLDGTVERVWHPDGLHASIAFPLAGRG